MKFKKMLSIFMALTFAFAMALSTNAADNSLLTSDNVSFTEDSFCPEILLQQSIDVEKHDVRLKNEETDLNSLVYKNTDGSKSMYYFDHPVKYVEKDGSIKDKSNKLSKIRKFKFLSSQSVWTNLSNNVKSSFPEFLTSSNGILLEYNNYKMELTPQDMASNKIKGSLESQVNGDASVDIVKYGGVFGSETTLNYTTSFSGFKEDIILNNNIGTNQFVFSLKVDGIYLSKINDEIYVFDTSTGSCVGEISPVYVFDSAGNETYNNSISLLQTQNNVYQITINVDTAFLSNPNTVYPVTIDPTVILYEYYDIDINDTMLCEGIAPTYSGKTTTYGAFNLFYVGTAPRSSGVSRALLKFNNLASNPEFTSIASDDILYAALVVEENSNTTNAMDISAMEYCSEWSENTSTWSNSNPQAYSMIKSATVTVNNGNGNYGDPNDNRYAFNITAPILKLKRGETMHGIMLKADVESEGYKRFSSSEMFVNNRPFIIINYSPSDANINSLDLFRLKNKQNGNRLIGSYYPPSMDPWVLCETASNKMKSDAVWRFENQNDGFYRIRSLTTTENHSVRSMLIDNYASLVADQDLDVFYWRLIPCGENQYLIMCKQGLNGTTMFLNSYDGDVVVAPYNGNYSIWIFEPFQNTAFWGNAYTNSTDAKHIYYTVDSSISSSMIPLIRNACERWNGISSNVQITYVPYANRTALNDPKAMLVTIKNLENYPNYLAVTIPQIEGSYYTLQNGPPDMSALLNSNWRSVDILVNINMVSGWETAKLETVFTHEFGHALKLSHPNELSDPYPTSTPAASFPAIMQPLIGNTSGVSDAHAMCFYCSWTISAYDKSALIAKWGY